MQAVNLCATLLTKVSVNTSTQTNLLRAKPTQDRWVNVVKILTDM